ncbi:hypothetical protein D5S18_06735 [Nocardia panacis]|uniref:SRPBCC family protein n=1 Tax=Nocardia panacis TaxID=2340916 RepID=A0A3A4KQK0_9NOCA|nr:SRPBCC family protein [Nocardia panacis]RJO77965.1 hypothetical protein D5S18_06735 [Nocardia panacis]
MRTKSDIHIVVDSEPARVFDALAAVDQLPQWSPTHDDARIATRDESGRPRRVFVNTNILGSLDMQVLEYDWGESRAAWKIVDSSRGCKGNGWCEVSTAENETRLWFRTEVYVPLPIPGILLKRNMRKYSELAAQNFIGFLDGFPRPIDPFTPAADPLPQDSQPESV